MKEQVELGMLRGRQGDTTEVSMALAVGSMVVDVMPAGRQRLETYTDWIWGRC